MCFKVVLSFLLRLRELIFFFFYIQGQTFIRIIFIYISFFLGKNLYSIKFVEIAI
jgi:hypothetical protein